MNGERRFNSNAEPQVVHQKMGTVYDFVPSFAVATATTDYDLKAQQSSAFLNVKTAQKAVIWSDQDITIKFNSTNNPSINIDAAETPADFDRVLEITNIYITNASGSTANIKVMLV